MINSLALDPTMFTDNKNLFYEHKDLKTLFCLVNQELQNVNEWFKASKVSLDVFPNENLSWKDHIIATTRFHFTYYSCVVSILFDTGLYNSVFFTYSF